jgi:hypothetical protein
MEYLFAKHRMYDVLNAIGNEIKQKVNQLTSYSFEKKSVDEIAKEIFEEHKMVLPVLDEAGVHQKDPKDVNIDIPTRGRYGGFSTVAGTKFEIIVPFSGDRDLFNIAPSTFSMNVPYGNVYGNELQFVYEIPSGREKNDVYEDFKRNLNNIKSWLNNTEKDATAFNSNIIGDIKNLVTLRKKKIDDDKTAANSSGIPIR